MNAPIARLFGVIILLFTLLTLFSRSEALYEKTSEGSRLKPLVVMLSEALEARSANQP